MSSFDSEQTDRGKPIKSLSSIVKNFADTTSMQGVPNINTSKHWFPRALWTVLLIGSLIVMTLHLKLLFDTYYSWPSHSRVSLGFDKLEFPAVTICNVNPIRRSQLYLGSASLQHIVEITQPDNIVKKMNEHRSSNKEKASKPSDGKTSGKTDQKSKTIKDVPNTTAVTSTTKKEENGLIDTKKKVKPNQKQPTTAIPLELALATNARVEATTTEHRGLGELPTTIKVPSTATTRVTKSMGNNGRTDNNPQTATQKKKEMAKEILFKKVDAKNEMTFINKLDFKFHNMREKVKHEMQKDEGIDETQIALPQKSMMSKLVDEFHYLFSQEERSTRIKMGHQLEDMLVDCSFAGRVCHPQNFSLRATIGMGNCFTLQHNGLVAHTSGTKNGMNLIIYLEDDEYLRGLTSGSGGQVLIHRRQTCPFPQNDGIAVASGSESNIGLRLVNINRLGLPHGTCEDGDVFKETYGYLYTRQACRVFCLQNLISSKCSCYDEDEEELNIIAKIQEKYPPCRNMTSIRCMMEVQKDYTQGKEKCVCDNPCRETRYEYSLSSRHWPSDDYAKVLIAALCEKKNATDCQKLKDMDIRKLSQKFIKLNIYYEDLNYENITEEEDYEASQFISDVGGTIGLWVGLSVLSMFEVVELFLRLFEFITISVWCRSKTDKNNANFPRQYKSNG